MTRTVLPRLLFFLLGAALSVDAHATSRDVASLEKETLRAVNEQRRREGLPRLARSEELTRIARAHSEHQARAGHAGHAGAGGSDLGDRAREGGIRYRAIAENVAMNYGYSDPVGVAVQGWMESKGHRRNILDEGFTETGVGVAIDAGGKIYFTQMFVRPAPAPPKAPSGRRRSG